MLHIYFNVTWAKLALLLVSVDWKWLACLQDFEIDLFSHLHVPSSPYIHRCSPMSKQKGLIAIIYTCLLCAESSILCLLFSSNL